MSDYVAVRPALIGIKADGTKFVLDDDEAVNPVSPSIVTDQTTGAVSLVVGDDPYVLHKTQSTADHMRFSGRVVANYGTLTGYTTSNCTIALVDTPAGGPTRIKENSGKSIRATSSGALSNAEVSFPVIARAGNPSGRVDLWVYVEDLASAPYFTLYLSVESGYSNFYQKSLATPIRAGWHHYSVLASEFTVGAGSPTLETVKYGKVRWGCSSATSVIIDRLVFGASGVPLCTMFWDDGIDTAYDYVLPLLNKYKLVGNFSIIKSLVGTANYLSERQVKSLAEAGHRLVTHGHTNLSTLSTIEDAYADIDSNRAYLDALGVNVDSDVYVWPNGIYMYSAGNTGLMDYLAANNYVGAYAAGGVHNTNELVYDKWLTSRQNNDVSVATATILSRIEDNAAAGRSSALMGHDVVVSGATGSQTNLADLDTVLAGIAALRDAGTIQIVSARDYLLLNSKA
jgi:hypothetical protein